jgi:hypothetical protein
VAMGNPALILVVSFWVMVFIPLGLRSRYPTKAPRNQIRKQAAEKGSIKGANSEKSGCGADLAQGPDALFDRRVAGEKP